MVQSNAALHIPSPNVTSPASPTGYLQTTLLKGLALGIDYLSSVGQTTEVMSTLQLELQAAPDGAYLISHNKKSTSTQHTNFIISLTNPTTYAILATMDTALTISLPTLVTIRGQHHH